MNKQVIKEIVECVVSYSIDYKNKSLLCDEDLLKNACVDFANGQNIEITEEEFNAILDHARKQKKPIGAYPAWVIFALVIGIVLAATELITLFLTGFGIVFIFFLLLAASLISTSFSYMRSVRKARIASIIWKACLNKPSKENMVSTLQKMQSIYQ